MPTIKTFTVRNLFGSDRPIAVVYPYLTVLNFQAGPV